MEQSQHKFDLFRFFPGFLVDKAFNEIYLVLLFWQTKTCIQKNLGQPFLEFTLFLPLHEDMIEYTNVRNLSKDSNSNNDVKMMPIRTLKFKPILFETLLILAVLAANLALTAAGMIPVTKHFFDSKTKTNANNLQT